MLTVTDCADATFLWICQTMYILSKSSGHRRWPHLELAVAHKLAEVAGEGRQVVLLAAAE